VKHGNKKKVGPKKSSNAKKCTSIIQKILTEKNFPENARKIADFKFGKKNCCDLGALRINKSKQLPTTGKILLGEL